MGIDLDILDDIFAVGDMKNARPTGKFQPKAKLRITRNVSPPTSISSSSAALIDEAVENELTEPATIAKPTEHNDQWDYGSVSFLDEKVGNSTVSLQPDFEVVPNNGGGWHSCMEKSVSENADIFIGLDSLDDFIPQAASDIEGASPPQETRTVVVPNSHNGEGGIAVPVLSSVDDSKQTSKETDARSFPSSVGEPTVSSSDGVDHMDNGVMETNEIDVMDLGNMSELTTRSDKRTGRFHPKPKVKMQEICRQGRVESVSSLFCPQQVSPAINYADKEPLPSFEHEDVLDLSSIGFTPAIPVDATYELPVNDGSMNLMEMNQLVPGIHLDSIPEIPAKLTSRRSKTRKNEAHTASDPSQPQENVLTSTLENEPVRSLRPRKPKTNICELGDGAEDEILAGRVSSDECLGCSALEDDVTNEEYPEDCELLTKKVKWKSEKQDSNNEKTARKRRKTSKGASEQNVDAKPKKFSRSTRRRKVDRVLLETPEDEIDYQKVPLRDLILLAEHKERQMKKEESLVGAPSTKLSHDSSSEFLDEDNDGHLSPRAEESNIYLNYQTYMDSTPITRWSKQDTELFYEGVRQFGTDLSLIQQLFPDRTRHQIKLKYKKEERQQPLRLCDALTNRAKDHSHFEAVIVRLQQITAEENENADKNGSTELGEDNVADEGIPDASDVNGKEAKNEQIERQEKEEDTGEDLAEDGSPSKLYDSEDDLFRWSQYKSDT